MLAGASAGVVAGAGARVLVGRVRRGARVGPPGCETVVGAGWALVAGGAAAGAVPGGWVAPLLALVWFGAAAGAVDVRHRRLPDALTLPALPVALLLLVPLGGAALGRAVAVAATAVALHAAVHLAAPSALGAGDVKLAAPLGAVLGAVAWPAALLAAVLASVLTAGAAVLLRRRAGLPHGPSMLLATALVSGVGAVGGG
ncbi:MAG: prepilin peptidase [Pseudonocardiales bacterium]|nr:prepilin peptidase [Pseudonocardiales bacterium]